MLDEQCALSERACLCSVKRAVVVPACFYMNPCEKWPIVTGLTVIMHRFLERSHIYCSYLQQGRKTATSFLPNNSSMPRCSLEFVFWTCCLNVVFRSFNKYLFHRSDYEEMPLQNGQAIRAKYKEESDSD